MRKRNLTALIAAVLLAVTLFASCASAKPETPEPISEPETDTSVFDPTETTEDSALPEEEETEETEPEDAELPVEIVPVAESESESTSETEEASESEKASETEKASESEKPKETEKKTEKKEEKKTENKTTEKKVEEKKETEKKTEEKKAATAEKDSSGKPKYKYYLIVDKKGNTVTVYTYDDNGKYTKPVFSMICSTGGGTMSKGVYNIRNTNSYKWHGLFGGVYGQYVTQIKGNILFHSVPYKKNGDKGSLKYAEFDKLGTSCSMGCVRLQVKDAKWIYDNRKNVSGVEFTNTGSTGPLGRPSAPKISGNTACRGWDPTDPDPNNPWKTGQKEETKETESATEPVTETATEPASESDKTSESATEPASETEKTSENTTEPASETEKTSENATEPASETEKESENATEPASETTPEPASEPEKEPESTSKPESDTEKESESATKPESETQKESESTTKQAESEKPADTEKPQDSEKPAEAEKPEESQNP